MENSKWVGAINKDMSCIAAKREWNLAELPPGFKAIGGEWIFERKVNAVGTIQRY